MSSFGKQRLADFYIDPSYVNINHGSYGYSPKSVIQYRRFMQEQAETNNEKWFRATQMYINDMRSYIAGKINCSPKNVFIIQNATDGINSIAKSLKWSANDVVLLPNIAYSCVRKTFSVIKQKYGITIVDLVFTTQDFQSPENIQLKVQEFVNNYPKKIKLAVFDHVSSIPSIVFPVDTLQAFCEEKGITFIVDGAHAIGNVSVNMAEINANAYYSNFHKWSFCPKNASFLYLDDSLRDIVKPSLTGNFHGQGPQKQYYWTGTRDLSSYLSIRKGIQYHQSFGLNSVIFHNHNLIKLGGKKMAQIWGTKLMTDDPRLLSSMVNVEVPSKDGALCQKLANDMLYDVNCYIPIYTFDGKVYCRVSAQVYNEITDYEFAATTFLSYLKKASNSGLKKTNIS